VERNTLLIKEDESGVIMVYFNDEFVYAADSVDVDLLIAFLDSLGVEADTEIVSEYLD